MKKKTLSYILIFILIISVLAIKVYAANSFTTTLTPSSTNVSADTEVVITVAVSNLNVGDNGISAFTAYLDYDTDVFETLTDSSVEGLNNWTATYSTSSGQIALLKSSFVNEDQDIMQITLRVKSDAEEGLEGTVTLSNVVVSNNDDDITGSNVSTTITVGEATEEESGSDNETNNNASNNGSVINITTNATVNNSANTSTTDDVENDSVNSVSNYSISTNSSDDSDMPYTGSDSSAIAKIILGVVLISLVIYIKFKKIDEDVK